MKLLYALLIISMLALGPLAQAVECIMPQADIPAAHKECPFAKDVTIPIDNPMTVAECTEIDATPPTDSTIDITFEQAFDADYLSPERIVSAVTRQNIQARAPPASHKIFVSSRMLLLRAGRLLI